MGVLWTRTVIDKVQHQEVKNLPRLIIHLDVNKTIVMADPVQNKWFERVCNDILTEKIYGRIAKDENGKPRFVCQPNGFCQSRFDLTKEEEEDDNLLNYYEFVEKTFKRPHLSAPCKERRTSKRERSQAKCSFTDSGQPGEQFAHLRKEMLVKMALGVKERGVLEAAGIPVRGQTEGSFYRFLVPAFFELIMDLTTKGRDFSLVFRTFGIDMDSVKRELNLFCEGKHPIYPNVRFDGSGNSQDLRLYSENCGKIEYEGKPNPKLRWGTFRRPKGHERKSLDLDSEIIEGHKEVFTSIHNKSLKGLTTGISDDYSWWHNNDELSKFGKLFLIDPEDKRNHQMFFDDNIRKGDLAIVDCRNLKTLEPISFDDAFRVYVDFADSYGIISDDRWFINAIEVMERNRREL